MLIRLSIGSLALGALTGCHALGMDCTDDLQFRVTPTARTVAIGESFTPSAEFRGCRGSKHLEDTIRWSATDTTFVRVDSVSGQITGRAKGTTQVQARGAKYGQMPPITVTVE